jgi:hypothetical protein
MFYRKRIATKSKAITLAVQCRLRPQGVFYTSSKSQKQVDATCSVVDAILMLETYCLPPKGIEPILDKIYLSSCPSSGQPSTSTLIRFESIIYTATKWQDLFYNIDMAAKRRKKHKNKISGFVISMCYNEQKSKF